MRRTIIALVGAAALSAPVPAPAADAARAFAAVPAITPGTVLGGRVVQDSWVDPGCLVTRGTDGQVVMLAFVTRTRIGEWAGVMTPAFGRCDRPQNPYRARIVRFDRVDVAGATVTLRRGTLACSYTTSEPNSLTCNRTPRCDLAFHRCDHP
jgi:hypothetical protein